MELENENPARPWRRLLIWAIIVAGVAALGIGGWRIYRKWWPERLAERARLLVERNDVRSTSQPIRRALQINSNNVSATRLAAQLTERLNDPESLRWREKVVAMRPDSVEDILACAATAIRFGNIDTA